MQRAVLKAEIGRHAIVPPAEFPGRRRDWLGNARDTVRAIGGNLYQFRITTQDDPRLKAKRYDR
jgi:hypothetical protein